MKQHPQKLDLTRVPGKPKRRKKITLVFDEEKRKDFLSGFHKRKLQRKKKAKEDLEKMLKEERKKIKQNARERYQKMLSHRQVPELEELLSREEFDVGGTCVSVLELDVVDLQKKCENISANNVVYDEEEIEEKEESDVEEELTGMELKKTVVKKKADEPVTKMDSKKGIKHVVKQASLKQVQNSKAFKIKQRQERSKNIKESRLKAKAKEGAKGKRASNLNNKQTMKKRKKKGKR